EGAGGNGVPVRAVRRAGGEGVGVGGREAAGLVWAARVSSEARRPTQPDCALNQTLPANPPSAIADSTWLSSLSPVLHSISCAACALGRPGTGARPKQNTDRFFGALWVRRPIAPWVS